MDEHWFQPRIQLWYYNASPQCRPNVSGDNTEAADTPKAKVPVKFLLVAGNVDFSNGGSFGVGCGEHMRRSLRSNVLFHNWIAINDNRCIRSSIKHQRTIGEGRRENGEWRMENV